MNDMLTNLEAFELELGPEAVSALLVENGKFGYYAVMARAVAARNQARELLVALATNSL